ncbi:cation transporter [Candidatus Woesearchaeota archaeon]|nr:cation transporter [Candidatus Woesearchaeota archaeon]
MRRAAFKATIVGLVANTALFALKIVFGLMSNSIALISDAINSFTDIASAIAIFIAVKVGRMRADVSHPFGHHRAEPIAGFFVAVLAGVLGFEVIKAAIERIIFKQTVTFGWIPITVLLIVIIVKYSMASYLKKIGKKFDSPAILASAFDSKNDVYISGTAMIGIIAGTLGYPLADPLAAIFVGGWVLKTAYELGSQNVDYLVGKCPPQPLIDKIREKTLSIKGVKGVHDIKAHYVGNFVHVGIHIELDKKLTTFNAHLIVKKVGKAVESLPSIDNVFIHIDPS